MRPPARAHRAHRTARRAAVGGSCSLGPSTVLTSRNTALSASLAAAVLDTPTPLSVATIANKFVAPPQYFNYEVDWSVSGLKIDMSSNAIGGRVNSKKAVSPLPALLAAGTLDVALSATVGGVQESEVFATDLAGRGAGMSGCALTLRARQRDFFLDCSKAQIDLPSFTFLPKARLRAGGGEAWHEGCMC